MTPVRYIEPAIVILACCACLMAACKEDKPPAPKPWTFESERAPYRVEMPPEWEPEEPEKFNSFADFAARKGQLHLIVIPQKLPRLAGAPPPDALALKRAAISVMEESISDLEVLKQGPVTVSGLDGHSVFSKGTVQQQEHHYITTYVTQDDWGYQIIAWAPSSRERALTAEVDRLLDRWTFDVVPGSDTAGSSDAGERDTGT